MDKFLCKSQPRIWGARGLACQRQRRFGPVCLLPFLLLRPLRRPSPSAAAAASHPRDPGVQSRRVRPSVGGAVCPRAESPAPRRAAAAGPGRDRARRRDRSSPPLRGEPRRRRCWSASGEGGSTAERRSRARVGWGVPTGPRPPRPPAQLRSRSPAGGPGVRGAPSPVRSSATQAYRDAVRSGDEGDWDAPVSRSRRRGGPEARRAAPLEPGAAAGTQLGAQRAGGAPQSQQAGPASWVTGPAGPAGKK
nr:collagen alpha-1(I) chain-like [Vulpes vulpes]